MQNDADPDTVLDPAYHFDADSDADPEPDFLFDADVNPDADPGYQIKIMRIRITKTGVPIKFWALSNLIFSYIR